MNNSTFKRFLSLLFLFPLINCTTTNLQVYEKIDLSDKTVSINAGAGLLKGKIKQKLRADGWTIKVLRGPRIVEGQLGSVNGLSINETFQSKYIIDVYAEQFDYCFDFSPAVRFEIYMVDVSTSEEVINMSGTGCEENIAKNFIDAINGGKKSCSTLNKCNELELSSN